MNSLGLCFLVAASFITADAFAADKTEAEKLCIAVPSPGVAGDGWLHSRTMDADATWQTCMAWVQTQDGQFYRLGCVSAATLSLGDPGPVGSSGKRPAKNTCGW